MGVMQGLLTSVVMVLTSLKSMGPLGRLGYVLGLAVWTFCCLPTTPIELASGFIFPLWASTLLSVAGKTTGSVLALLLGRRFLKPLVSRLLERSGSNAGHSSAMHRHLVSELQKRPIQTMSILRAAPLPTPFKIYGLCMFQPELVPVNTYFVVALIINTAWSLVWSLTGSSASSLQEITEGRTDMSKGKLVAQGFAIASFLLAFGAFGRFAKAQMQPPSEDGESTPNAAARGARGVRSAAGTLAGTPPASAAQDASRRRAHARRRPSARAAARATDKQQASPRPSRSKSPAASGRPSAAVRRKIAAR